MARTCTDFSKIRPEVKNGTPHLGDSGSKSGVLIGGGVSPIAAGISARSVRVKSARFKVQATDATREFRRIGRGA